MTSKTLDKKVTSEEIFNKAEDKRLKLNDAGKYPNYTVRSYSFYEKIIVTGEINLEADWDNLSNAGVEELVKQYRKDSRVDWHEAADNRDLHVLDSFIEKYDNADATLITGESLMDIEVGGYDTLEHEWDDTKGYQVRVFE